MNSTHSQQDKQFSKQFLSIIVDASSPNFSHLSPESRSWLSYNWKLLFISIASFLRNYRITSPEQTHVTNPVLTSPRVGLKSMIAILSDLPLAKIKTKKKALHTSVKNLLSELFKLMDGNRLRIEEKLSLLRILRILILPSRKALSNTEVSDISSSDTIYIPDVVRSLLQSQDYFRGLMLLWSVNSIEISREVLNILSTDPVLFGRFVGEKELSYIGSSLLIASQSLPSIKDLILVHKKTLSFLTHVDFKDNFGILEMVLKNKILLLEKLKEYQNDFAKVAHSPWLQLENLYTKFILHLFSSNGKHNNSISNTKQLLLFKDILKSTADFFALLYGIFKIPEEDIVTLEAPLFLSAFTIPDLKGHLDLMITCISFLSSQLSLDMLGKDTLFAVSQLFIEATSPSFLEVHSSLYLRLLKLLMFYKTSTSLSHHYDEMTKITMNLMTSRISELISRFYTVCLSNTELHLPCLKSMKFLLLFLKERNWRSCFLDQEKLGNCIQQSMLLRFMKSDITLLEVQCLIDNLEIIHQLSEDSNLRRRMRDEHSLSNIIGILIVLSISAILCSSGSVLSSVEIVNDDHPDKRSWIPVHYLENMITKCFHVLQQFRYDESFLRQLCDFIVPSTIMDLHPWPFTHTWISTKNGISIIPYLFLYSFSFCGNFKSLSQNHKSIPIQVPFNSKLSSNPTLISVISIIYILISSNSLTNASRNQILQVNNSISCLTQLFVQNEYLEAISSRPKEKVKPNPLDQILKNLLGDSHMLKAIMAQKGFSQFSRFVAMIDIFNLKGEISQQEFSEKTHLQFNLSKQFESSYRLLNFYEKDNDPKTFPTYVDCVLSFIYTCSLQNLKEKWTHFDLDSNSSILGGNRRSIWTIPRVLFALVFHRLPTPYGSENDVAQTFPNQISLNEAIGTLSITPPAHLTVRMSPELLGAVGLQWIGIMLKNSWFSHTKSCFQNYLLQLQTKNLSNPWMNLQKGPYMCTLVNVQRIDSITIVCYKESASSAEFTINLDKTPLLDHSPVLKAMFEGPYLESETKKLTLYDFGEETIATMIQVVSLIGEERSCENILDFFLQNSYPCPLIIEISKLLKSDPVRLLHLLDFLDRYQMGDIQIAIELIIINFLISTENQSHFDSTAKETNKKRGFGKCKDDSSKESHPEDLPAFSTFQIAWQVYIHFAFTGFNGAATNTGNELSPWPEYLYTSPTNEPPRNNLPSLPPLLIQETLWHIVLHAPELLVKGEKEDKLNGNLQLHEQESELLWENIFHIMLTLLEKIK